MNKLIVAKNELQEYDYEYYNRKNRKNQRKKNKKKNKNNKNKSKNKLIFLGCSIMMLLTCLFILNRYVEITRLRLEVSNLDKEIVKLEKEKQDLVTELESVKNTNKVEEAAKVKLGMDYPNKQQIVYLDVDENIFEDCVEKAKGIDVGRYLKNIVNVVISLF